MSPLPLLGAQLQVLSAKRPWPDPGLKLPGFELASGCSQWADRIGYSVSFIYLEPHHRNLLVPKNCLLALSSQGAAVSISTITISFACWNSLVPTEWPALLSRMPWGPTLAPCPSPKPRDREGFPSLSCLPTVGNPAQVQLAAPAHKIPLTPLLGDFAPPVALGVSTLSSLALCSSPPRGE